jgi:hypothetical protein
MFDTPNEPPAAEKPVVLSAVEEETTSIEKPPPEPGAAPKRPEKVQTIGVMMLVGGIYAILHFLGVGGGSGFACCIWPGLYYALVVGILAIVKGSALLGANPQNETAPKAVAIMQIVNIINFDVVNCVLGVLTLIFLGEPQMQGYFRNPDAQKTS